jgi:hypothetical protein
MEVVLECSSLLCRKIFFEAKLLTGVYLTSSPSAGANPIQHNVTLISSQIFFVFCLKLFACSNLDHTRQNRGNVLKNSACSKFLSFLMKFSL